MWLDCSTTNDVRRVQPKIWKGGDDFIRSKIH
jgi:hypothetical protein